MTAVQDLEKKLTQLDQDALADNVQLEIVLNCISQPLQWFHDDNQVAMALVGRAVWRRHVWSVFKDIVPRWTFILSNAIHQPLLKSTLTFNQCSTTSFAFQMAQISFPLLIECLSTEQDQTSLDTLEFYASCLKYLSLDNEVFKIYVQQTQSKDVVFLVQLICSLPGHLANIFGIQLNQVMYSSQHEWYMDRNFYAKLSKRIAENVDSKSVLFSQELIAKIARQGHEDIFINTIYPLARASPDKDWSLVLEPSFDQLTKTILYHVKQYVLPICSIKRASKELAYIMFNKVTGTKEMHIHNFLNTALIRLAKIHWADDTLARLVISTAIRAQGNTSLVNDFLKKVIEIWSDKTFIKHASTRERTYMTTVILSLLAYVPQETIQYTIMGHTSLFSSVTRYFDSGDMVTAQLGAVMAEAIAEKSDPEKPVDTGLVTGDELKRLKKLINIRDDDDNDNDNEEYIISKQESEDDDDDDNENEQEEEMDPDAIYCPDDDDEKEEEEDSDNEFQAYEMEEESDDEGMKKESLSKSKVVTKKPVFVLDLIRYLKDKNDPSKLEIGLHAAEQVIQQKATAAGSGTELSETSVELARYLINFPETYEIDDFRSLQQRALTALMVAVPKTVTGFIIDELYDRNTSNGQKQMILAAISLAVRELSGWSSINLTSKSNTIEEGHDNNSNDSLIAVGKTTFLSKRIQVEKQQRQNIVRNQLSGLAGPIFFFPLLVGWWEGLQGRIKYWIGNDKILAERFIMTLNIILHSSTNIPDKRKIVKEYFEFVSSMRYAQQNSFGIKKALLLGLDCILNTTYKGQETILFFDYTRELEETKSWLEEIMESNSEPKLQEIAIGILVKLSQIALLALK